MNPEALLVLAALPAGLALGSFAVTAGLRMASGDTALRGRSRCDGCAVQLGFAQTIPLVSYWRSGGACSACGGRIDAAHLVGEITGAVVCLGALLAAGPIRALALAPLGLVLIAASTVDWKIKRLPDVLTLMAGLLCAGLALSRAPAALAAGALASVLVVVCLQTLRHWSMRRGRDPGLGLGDVKLAAALALWLGATTPWMILGASLLGLAAMAFVKPADGRLPFGPAIAIAAWVVGLGMEWARG